MVDNLRENSYLYPMDKQYCTHCDGDGFLEVLYGDVVDAVVQCDECHGDGYAADIGSAKTGTVNDPN